MVQLFNCSAVQWLKKEKGRWGNGGAETFNVSLKINDELIFRPKTIEVYHVCSSNKQSLNLK
jgi:hypothetical protein